MRNRNIWETVFILLALGSVLIVSVAAGAQTSSPTPSPSAQTPQATPIPEQPQSEPSQQNPAATPAPAPQQRAPEQPSASSQPSQSSSGPQTQSSQPKSIDDELQLTPDQKQKIAAVVDDENRQISAVRDDNSMGLEQKQQKVMQIRQAGTPKIKAILTPDQLQRLAVIQQRMRDQGGSQSGTQSGNQGTTHTPPQH
jgi:periplasmic protein CpxP/Spy